MKRIVYFASILFLASFIVSCQKELQNEETNPTAKGGVTVNVVAGGEVESKTSAVVDGTTTKFKWTEGDAITLYEFVDGEQNEYRNSNATTISTDGYSATFKVTLENSDPEGSNYVYTACYPAEAFTTSNSIERYQIPSTQNLSADGNFDPAADIMFGKSAPRNERVADDTDLGFSFKRLGTVVKLTLKGISSGEKINEISITAPVNIAGYCKINFMTGEVGTLAYSVATNTIKLNAGGFTSDGEDVVWFRCIEGSWEAGKKFTIVIDTDKAGYTKEITIPEGGLEFSAGGLTKLTIGSLGDYRKEKSNVVYSKVTSAPDDWSGEYLLVYESSTTEAYVWTGVDASSCYAKASITDNNISSLPAGAAILTIATMDGGYSIKVNGDDSKFVGQTSDANGMSINGTPKANTISINDDGSVQITSSSAVMRYNANNGQDRFRYYKSSSYSAQQPVQLYKKKSTLPTINAKNINDVAATGVVDAKGTYSIENIDTDDIEITYDGEVVTSAAKTTDGNFEYTVAPNYSLEAQEGTITFTSESGNVNKSIKVSQLASVFVVEADNPVVIENKAGDEGSFIIKSSFGGALSIDDEDNFEISDTYDANVEGVEIVVKAKKAGAQDDRTAKVTVTRDGQENVVVNIKQNKQGAQPLAVPTDVTVTTYTTSKIAAEWTGDDNASSYDWIISTCATAEEAKSNNVKNGNTTGKSIDEAGTFATGTYYFYVRSVGDGVSYTTSDYASSGSFEIQEQHYLTVDFEKASNGYKLWAFNNIVSQKNNITGHNSSSYCGNTDGKESGSITTKQIIASPQKLTCFISKETNNTTSSNWYIKVSSDGKNWTEAKSQSATDMNKGEWKEFSCDLTSYSDVYVGVFYSGTSAVRAIDDIELVYAGAEIEEPSTPKHDVSLGSHDNGTITASVGGQTISLPASLEEGTEISITATPDTGYDFSSWSITGASAASTSSTTTVTVGTSNITIEATFTPQGQGGGSYTITFAKGSGDGSTASTSTACSTVVSDGSDYLSGNLATASTVYYSGDYGLKLGSSKNDGTIKMSLSTAGQVTPTSIVVRAKLYNSGKAATLKVNGSATQNLAANFVDYTYNITSKITYIELVSSKYCWIESVTVNY